MGKKFGNRKPLRMDKVYKRYLSASRDPRKLMAELGIDTDAGDGHLPPEVGMRKDTELHNDEKQFLLAVERGDIPRTRQLLEESQIYFSININCVDPLGRTALLIAIENENIELIELLLSYQVELGDSLLHAINEENVEAVEILLKHQTTNKKDLSRPSRTSLKMVVDDARQKAGIKLSLWKSNSAGPKLEDATATPKEPSSIQPELESTSDEHKKGFLGGVPSSSFTPDITPIILAAHRDNYEIIKILLDRGDRIHKPHDIRCSCVECKGKSGGDSLNYSRSRINAYRALVSPSLIALSSKDPILTAFELSWELRRLSRLENEFKKEYEALAKQCSDFAVDLLEQTRGSQELEVVLNHDPDGPVGESTDRMNLARLKLAIKFKQKRFVAHPNCQQLLSSLWYEGLPGFRRRHIVFKVLLTVSVCLLYPLMSLTYLACPKSSVGRFMRRPFIKFICHSASYMTFLFLLILASQRIESVIKIGSNEEGQTTRSRRGSPPTPIEYMIMMYVLGLIWSEVKQLWDEGAKAYVQDLWNILDFITNSLYIATFTLKFVAYLRVEKEKRDNNPTAYAPRDEWDAFDPNLISEGLFAAANIFSSLKLIYIFTVNPHLGPLQISLGRMVRDIMQFLLIAALVIFAYSCGVNQLYWYYAEERTKDCNVCLDANPGFTLKDCDCDRTLSNLFEILQTLYFAVYGLVDIKHFEIKQKHDFTQFVGKLMFGTYCAIMIVVLINMLIAMLSNSYQYISNDSDSEWKYARAKLWMSYFEEGGTLPAPFNIIPTPKTLYYVFQWIKEKLCHCSQTHKRSKWQSIRKLVKKVNEREAKYQSVMRDLVKRYVMARQRSQQSTGVTEDDLNEIKQEISSFRYELLEILRESGMKIPMRASQKKNSGKGRRKSNRLNMERQLKAQPATMEPLAEDQQEVTETTNSGQQNDTRSTQNGNAMMTEEPKSGTVEQAKEEQHIYDNAVSAKSNGGYVGDTVDKDASDKAVSKEVSNEELPLDPAKLPGYRENSKNTNQSNNSPVKTTKNVSFEDFSEKETVTQTPSGLKDEFL